MFNRASLALLIATITLTTACSRSPEEQAATYLARGREQMAKHDYARALLEFRNAAKLKPKDAEPWHQIGLASLSAGNIREAAASFRKATELNPRHSEAQLKLAGLMAVTRNKELLEEAEKRLKDVLAASPESADAAGTLAIAEAQLGKTEDATKRLEDVLRKHPAHLQSAVALVRLRLAKKDVNGAEAILKKAVENGPKSADAAVVLGQFYIASGKAAPAEAELRRALSIDAKHAGALIALAGLQVATKRLDEAEATYRRVSALEDRNTKPLYATFLLRRGKGDAAVAEFRKLMDADPHDRPTRTRLVAAYVLLKRNGEAEKLLNSVLNNNPRDMDALLQRGELYLRSGKVREAEKDFRQALSFNPQSAEAHYALANVHRIDGSPSERLELAEALRIRPDMLAARLALARALLVARDASGALGVLDSTPADQKNALAVHVQRNWALLASGRTAEARTLTERLLAAAPVGEVILQDGYAKLAAKNHAAALARAEELLRANPDNVRAATLLADTFAGQNQLPKAVERLSRLTAERPKSAQLQMLLGRVANSAGDKAKARAAFEAAKNAAPELSTGDLALAELDVSENRLDEARKRLALVTAAEPRNAAAQLLAGHTEYRAGKRDDAMAKYRAAVAADSSNVIALNNLAYLLAPDKPDDALKLAEQALSLAPDHAAVQDTLGWVYYRKGMYRQAAEYLKAAVAKEPTPARQYHLGMTYVKAGEMNAGSELVAAAVKRDPRLPETERGW